MMDEDHIRIREGQKRVAAADSMIERVAKAFVAQVYLEAGGEVSGWNALDEESRNQARTAARAAIEAMREPTEKMVKAGEALDPGYEDGNAACESHWSAMIDAALGPVAKSPLTPDEREAYRWATGRSAP